MSEGELGVFENVKRKAKDAAYMLEIELKNEPVRARLYQKFEEIKIEKKKQLEKEISDCKAEMKENQEKRDYGASGKWLEILDNRDITHRKTIKEVTIKLDVISNYEPQSLEELVSKCMRPIYWKYRNQLNKKNS
jgi:hypothetical protein